MCSDEVDAVFVAARTEEGAVEMRMVPECTEEVGQEEGRSAGEARDRQSHLPELGKRERREENALDKSEVLIYVETVI